MAQINMTETIITGRYELQCANNLTFDPSVLETMRQSPTRNKTTIYCNTAAPITHSVQSQIAKGIFFGAKRAPSPACSVSESPQGSKHTGTKRRRSVTQSVGRCTTPSVPGGRRSETPASRKLPATPPLPASPFGPEPVRLPTARVLFDGPPSRKETDDFFEAVEAQVRDEFSGRWGLGISMAASPAASGHQELLSSDDLESLWGVDEYND